MLVFWGCLKSRKRLKILKTFDVFCSEYGLTYWLAFGTLLGAIRHKGYIPCDDDLGLMMPSISYMKMISLVNGGIGLGERYRIAELAINSPIPYHQVFL